MNILLATTTDEQDHIKQLGMRRLLKARKHQPMAVKKCVVLTLNVEAESHIYLIN